MLKLNNYILVLAFVLCFISFIAKAKEEQFREASYYLQPLKSDFILGKKKAPITVIEYSTLSCAHCGYFHEQVFDKIKTKYIDTGIVKWVNRQYVADAPSMKGALLAICGGEKKYYLYLKILFLKQSTWAYNRNFEEILKNIAKLSGMNEVDFNKCMINEEVQNYLTNQKIIAKKILNIKGTPTFFVNGKEAAIYDFDSFENKVKELVKNS